ncbi:hypothetical protein GCM10025794_36150 [Massilia kyonggiensis]
MPQITETFVGVGAMFVDRAHIVEEHPYLSYSSVNEWRPQFR